MHIKKTRKQKVIKKKTDRVPTVSTTIGEIRRAVTSAIVMKLSDTVNEKQPRLSNLTA